MPATGDQGRPVGRVRGLRVFPVRSMDADPVPEAVVLSTGLEHDRGWVVLDRSGAALTSRDAPQLSRVRALLPTAPGTGPQLRLPGFEQPGFEQPGVELPGVELPVRDASADAALSALLGRTVRVRAVAGAGGRDDAPVHLVSDGGGSGAERTRANIVLSLDAPGAGCEPGAERDWAGRRLQVGEVLLDLTRTPRNCAGIYADVARPGRVRVGDAVRLL